MQDSERHIPTRVDDPIPILSFEPLEFVLAVLFLGVGTVMNVMPIGAVGAGLILWLSRKLKRGAKRGAAQHALWSSGLSIDRAMKCFPEAWINDLVE